MAKKISDSKSKKNKSTKKAATNNKKNLKKKINKKKNIKNDSMFDKKISFGILDFYIIAIVIALVSCVGTGLILNYQYKKNNVLYNSALVSDESLTDFIKTYSQIVDNYYEEVDRKAMLSEATSAIVGYLKDNYSIYLDKDDAELFTSSLDSSYEGVGIVVSGNLVYHVYEESPAEEAGIKAGDLIVEINDAEINKDNVSKISELIKNNEKNHIVVLRNEEKIEFDVETKKVYIPTAGAKVIEKDGKRDGYIALTSFSTKSASQFRKELESIEDEGIDSLIIDLRGNSGGYLEVAKEIASMFLEKGKVIYSLQSKNDNSVYKDETDEKRDYKIVVLIDTSSASASEVLTGALKDSYGAIVVGEKSFGKGKVQTVMQNEDSIVKYTSAKWYRPNGECVDGEGIKPDYEVTNVVKNKIIYDKQLEKAIEIVNE